MVIIFYVTQNFHAKALGVQRFFEEAASGGRWERPQLHKMLEQLREGDIVVVWKLDRLSRSLKDLLIIIEIIKSAKADFKSLTEDVDTTSPAGRMMMQMLGAFAEFERAMIRERTTAGLVTARSEGRVGGRKSKLSREQVKETIKMIKSGEKTAADIARLFNVHRTTISRLLAQHGIKEFAKNSSEERVFDKQKI